MNKEIVTKIIEDSYTEARELPYVIQKLKNLKARGRIKNDKSI